MLFCRFLDVWFFALGLNRFLGVDVSRLLGASFRSWCLLLKLDGRRGPRFLGAMKALCEGFMRLCRFWQFAELEGLKVVAAPGMKTRSGSG